MVSTMETDGAATSRATTIAQIIKKRRPLADKIEAVEINLNKLSAALNKLEKQRDQLVDKVSDSCIIGILKEIDLSTTQSSIKNELATLKSLKLRFSRNTLNIGVVGRARQGKSRLLQSLTGLSSAEIPDGSGQHCTGVRSNIHHNLGETEAYAEVTFHTEHSFLDEVIAPYYRQLRLGSPPNTIQKFADNNLPELSNELAQTSQNSTKYEHLKRYKENLPRYRDQFSKASPCRVSRHEIREYVAQDTLDKKRIYFSYLAVKEVKIICSFPNVDIGQIAVVDMPGLGDTGIGDEERMIKTLGHDIDLVLFVKKVDSIGSIWAKEDIELYDMANVALTDLPIKEWSFMVLNQISGSSESRDNCEGLATSIDEKHINVQDVLIVDCTATNDVQSIILDRVLNYLRESIEELDRQYASACQDRLIQIQRSVRFELEKSKNVFGQASDDEFFLVFLDLFENFWDDLTRDLVMINSSMISERDNDDQNFVTAVDSAIASCRLETGIPDLKEIEQKCINAGGVMSGYESCMNEVRTHLSKQFFSLDIALKESLEDAKCRVVEVLKNNGRLGKIAEGDGSEFLRQLAELIPENYTGLRLGFETLATADLQYRGLVQQKIRKHLDVLTPDKTSYKLNSLWDLLYKDLTASRKIEPEEGYSKIANNLAKAQSEAVNNCQKELKNLLREPSQAGFAIVEEFTDRVLRAKGVRLEWQKFLIKFASEIWSNEFTAAKERAELTREWIQIIGEIEYVKKADSLKFLR